MKKLFFNPSRVLISARKIKGFENIVNKINRHPEMDYIDIVNGALSELEEDYSEWPEGQGFGSSDFTYAVKSFIDYMIGATELNGYWETAFIPFLTIVEYTGYNASLEQKSFEIG